MRRSKTRPRGKPSSKAKETEVLQQQSAPPVNLSATAFLCREVLWKGGNMIVQLKAIIESLYKEVK